MAKAMMMRILFVLGILLSWCLPARAAYNLMEPKVLGFTADGRTFVYIKRNTQSVREDMEIEAVSIDVRTAKEHRYSFDRFEADSPERDKFLQWLKKNPVRCAGGPRSPDGIYALQVLFQGTAGIQGQWKRQMYLYGQRESELSSPWGKLKILLTQGHKSHQLFKWEVRAEWRLAGGLIPCWSPDAQRLALVDFREGQGMRDAGEMSVRFVSLGKELTWEFPPLRP